MSAGSPRQRNPLLARLGRALEAALNRALALDAHTQQSMAALEGRRIGVELRGANLALAIGVRDARLVVGPHWEQPADLNLHASPASLLAFALRRGDDSPLPPGKVDISGDAELARRLEKLLRDFRPDVEEAFAQTFGDVLGVPLARALQRAFAWTRDSARALAQDSADYLREESRDLVAPAELEQFLDDVDGLRERADRLHARVRRLRARGDAV
jgi:ubiquinone biosynthesis accessory factor UbiJ